MTDTPTTMRLPPDLAIELRDHLFPGDRDEHGAVIAASVKDTPNGRVLYGHRLFLARDGVDYIAGERGYRMLTASFVRDCAIECHRLGMAYLAVHCHGGTDRVAFSPDDLASHHRGYPALLDIVDGAPVGGLVFATAAVAGDLWLPDDTQVELDELIIASRPCETLHPAPPARPAAVDERFDRQARIFGDRGQAILSRQRVGVIGAGGAGSLIVEYLAHLGVGEIVCIDPDRIEPSNLSRVVGSTRRDIRPWLTHRRVPRPLRTYFERRRTLKVEIARRAARRANPTIEFTAVPGDVTDANNADLLLDCDYIFLAADSMQARHVFNAIVHQYLIPGVQVGAKVSVDPDSGEILNIFSVVRPLIPGHGCLWCNELISPAKLQEEATDPDQRRRQRYVDGEDIPDPSVITLNALAAADAANDYLMSTTGLLEPSALKWTKYFPTDRAGVKEIPRRRLRCRECSMTGRLGQGPLRMLPVRLSQSP